MKGKGLMAAVIVALAVMVVVIAVENRRVKREIKTLKFDAQLEALASRLRVPAEAVYSDAQSTRAIAEARQRLYEEHGTKEFCPYGSVLQGNYRQTIPTGDWTEIANGSFENYMLNDAIGACAQLRLDLEHNQLVGQFLKDNPEVFSQRFRPPLLWLLSSYHPVPRLKAATVLLLAGDRSPEIADSLQEIVKGELLGWEYGKQDAQGLLDKYGLHPE